VIIKYSFQSSLKILFQNIFPVVSLKAMTTLESEIQICVQYFVSIILYFQNIHNSNLKR